MCEETGVAAGESGRRVSHKYHAIPTEVDGIRFASKKEARRYQDLRVCERGGYIIGLELQPAFELRSEDGKKIGTYKADFAYWQKQGSEHVLPRTPALTALTYTVEDVKGFKTPLYRWKKKHVEAQYGIEIREI